MDTAIQPMRPYNPGKLKDPSKQFLYVVPADRRRSIITVTPKSDPVLYRVAKQAAEMDDSLSDDAVSVDILIGGGPACALAILPVGATRSTRTWDHEVHFTRRVLHAAGMDDASVYPTPRYIAPVLASANPWFGNWGEAEGCRSQAAMMAQAEFYHRQGWDTIILDHEARWSVNGWGLQHVTPDDIARLREEEEL